MNEIERAAREAVEAAAAVGPTPVARLEARVRRLRRERALRGGLGSALVALLVAAGAVAALGSDEGATPVDTAGEVEDGPAVVSVSFPSEADEAREREVLQARVGGLGVPVEITGEWPELVVTVDGSIPSDDVAYVAGTPGVWRIVLGGEGVLTCPRDDAASPSLMAPSPVAEQLAERIRTLDARISEIEGQLASPDLGQQAIGALSLERADLLAERTLLESQLQGLEVTLDPWSPFGASVNGVLLVRPREPSCREALAALAASAPADADTIRTVVVAPRGGPVWAPHEDATVANEYLEPGSQMTSLDVAGSTLGRVAQEVEGQDQRWFLDGWLLRARTAVDRPPFVEGGATRFAVGLPADDLSALRAVLDAGSYEHPPTVTVVEGG